MTIITRAAALEDAAHEVLTLRRSQQHGQALSRRTALIDQLAERVVRAVTARTTLAARLSETATSLPVAHAAAEQVQLWRTQLDEDVETALAGDRFQTLQAIVQRAAAELESDARSFWQRYTAQVTPETSADILTALEADNDARLAVRRIRSLAETLSRLRERDIPTEDDIATYARTASEIREAWETLDVVSLDPEVVAFLRGANGDRGAPLSALTPTVMAWLMDRGATTHYAIRPAER
jgi:hypothetical protein